MTTNKLTYKNLKEMSDKDIEDLILEGVKTGLPIDIKSREDVRLFFDAHTRIAASLDPNDLSQIEAIAGYCMNQGI